jgi:pyruvate formate lyase activating enzyme
MPHQAKWWGPSVSGGGKAKIVCDLCPHVCSISDGGIGRCGARYALDGNLWTKAWGIGTSPVADPVEKKPLYHFLPGTKVLSFGLLGCNLSCAFCQNWSLSASRDYGALQSLTAEKCAQLALGLGCSAIAFTYNEPTISSEFCMEVSAIAHSAGIRAIAVSNGYIQDGARQEFFGAMDAANIDLKGISPSFYAKYCGGKLEPVLETIIHLAHSKGTWLEITNLLIPDLNDSERDLCALADWVGKNVGLDVPLHFSAFHPAYMMQTHPRTPIETLVKAKDIATDRGLRYVYLGNVPQPQCTFCPNCMHDVLRRMNYSVCHCAIVDGKCLNCGESIAGVFG